MRTAICDEFGIEYPIFAFTPSEHVAAAVSRAGGLGVLGCVRFNDPDELDRTLTWMDENTDGKPYGVDVVMPMKIPTEGKAVDLQEMIPQQHRDFVDETLRKLGVPPLPEGEGREGVLGWLHSVARSHVDIALSGKHRPVLIANALGSPPVDVIEQSHAAGVKVAALAGAAKHALSHVRNGVDIIVAQGYEAGGHTGEVASMVLTPEIVDAVGPDVPVLGAGGIGTGRQVAASLALGAQGVWTGSVWLTTEEYQNLNTNKGMTEAFLRATSSDTVRARVYTGKPARLLKTKWTDAWLEEGAPDPLPMPLQNLLVSEAHSRMNAHGDPDVVSMPVGQIVGSMNAVRPVSEVMADLVSGFDDAVARLDKIRSA
jgi:NAD(P)H-dependent flavin oxidoreductase YrpB (nitropropane dioxygenase family)